MFTFTQLKLLVTIAGQELFFFGEREKCDIFVWNWCYFETVRQDCKTREDFAYVIQFENWAAIECHWSFRKNLKPQINQKRVKKPNEEFT